MLERDLATYYDVESATRAARDLAPERVRQRDTFVRHLSSQKRTSLLEVGTGPGRDAAAFVAAGLCVAGVDLSVENARRCRDLGVDARAASVVELPFADRSFDAAWTMSTLLHLPDDLFDAALDELSRVLVPSSPAAIGVWGGDDWEGEIEGEDFGPDRYFRFRSDLRLRELLARHGTVEEFTTWTREGGGHRYQWCVLRVPGRARRQERGRFGP